MATDTKKRGQPTRYNEAIHVPWAVSLAQRGCSTAEIAEAFGVSERTIYRWNNAHPEFCHALSESKSRADELVVKGLYQRACGFESVDEKVDETVRDGVRTVKRTKTKKNVPPDVNACIFWLKNRQPQLWCDHPDGASESATDDAIKRAIAKAGLR